MSLGTVASLKDQAQTYQQLMMVAIYLQGTNTPLLLSTHPFDGAAGPTFPGIGILPSGNYLGRLAQQDVDAIQQRSQLGIDRAARFTIHILDADRFIYNNICKTFGFRGATMQVALIMWQAGTNNFSSDAPLLFNGTCDMEVPQKGGTIISVAANTGHNTATVKLPLFPIQNRCPLHFPVNDEERALAVQPDSTLCPYSVGQPGGIGNLGPSPNLVNSFGDMITDSSSRYISCDYTRSNLTAYQANVNPWDRTWGCMARLGNYATTSVAPDGDLWHDTSGHPTGAFASVEWSPNLYYTIGVSYTSGKSANFSFLNSAILGQYHNLLYGTQWVNPKLANVVETGNDSKSEAMICTGDIGDSGVANITVNGVMLNRAPSGDNNLWWDFNNTGARLATSRNTDIGYNGGSNGHSLSDPYGSIACLRTTFYKDIFTGFGTPQIRVLATGPQLWVYAPIQSISANGTNLVITWPSGYTDIYISGPGHIVGNSNSALNVDGGVYLSNTSSTITFASGASGSGTGGYIGQLSSLVKSNPAWVLLNILQKSNWDISEIDLHTFSDAAGFCDVAIPYVDQSGNNATHPRFKCQFVIEQRKTAAEVISAVLRCFNGYLAWGQNGLLQLYINQTLADSQPTLPAGSNYSGSAITSPHADGSTGSGYPAYLFNETNILRTSEGELDLEFEQNATVTTPNQIFIQFQDEDNQYVDDSLGEFDVNAVNRAGGSLQPGGSIVPETLNVLGISNFDQATRIANVYMAERQYGNELNEPIGTRIMTIGTTVKCEALRVGSIVAVSLQMYGYVLQLFRVLKIVPSTDGTIWKLTLQWHEDIWYEDQYGQTPQAFYSNAGLTKPSRPPLPWQPFTDQPTTASGDAYHTEWNFGITEIDLIQSSGSLNVQLQVTGVLPVNQIKASMQQPRVPIQATTSPTGGTIPGGHTYIIIICAIDAGGNYSPPSGPLTVTIPPTTNTNTLTISNIGWPLGANGYTVFVGTDHYNITQQFTTTGGAPPTNVTLGSIPNQITFAPPDLASGSMEVKGKLVIHEGIIGETVVGVSGGGHTVTIGAPATGSLGDLTVGGTVVRKLILIGRPNWQGNDLPIVEFNISSNSGEVITVDRDPTAGSPNNIQIGDVVVITSQANINSATTIGDTMFTTAGGNPYGGSGVDNGDLSFMIMIVRGTGRYQQRLITAVSAGTTYTIDHAWNIQPDATSMFIVVEKDWRYGSDVAMVNNPAYNSAVVSLLNIDNYLQKPVLVMVLVGDQQGINFASEFRSPFRIQWSFGVQGTRTIHNSDSQMPTDGLVLCDTSGLSPGFTTTLSAAVVDTTTLTIDVVSGTHFANGDYFTIDTEDFQVSSGGGTTTLTAVARGDLGTDPDTHLIGATVTRIAGLTFTLLPLDQQPNQPLIISKDSSDRNFVSIIVAPLSGDTFQNGGTVIYLPDDSAGKGTTNLKAPG